jgi:uncharacterized membrane protein
VTAVRATLAVVHVGTAAAWLGAMLYSLFVVRPRSAAFFSDEDDREDFAIVLAAGARTKVLALATVLALSGAGLTALELAADDAPGTAWAAVVAAKGLLSSLHSGYSATCPGISGRRVQPRTRSERPIYQGFSAASCVWRSR